MQTERISQFIATCCRLGHPGLALAAISGDKKRTTYSAVLSENDSEPTSIELPARLGNYVRDSLNPNATRYILDSLGAQLQNGNEEVI